MIVFLQEIVTPAQFLNSKVGMELREDIRNDFSSSSFSQNPLKGHLTDVDGILQGLSGQLVVGADYINQIWVPDTFFVNEKVARFHAATQENQFLRITHLGQILRRSDIALVVWSITLTKSIKVL